MSAAAFRDIAKDERGRFVSGNSGGGRPKGARAKLGEAFLQGLCDDFAQHGPATIIKVREEKPDQYLKVVASLMPKEIEPGERLLDALGELLSRVDGRTRTIAPVIEGEVRRIDVTNERD